MRTYLVASMVLASLSGLTGVAYQVTQGTAPAGEEAPAKSEATERAPASTGPSSRPPLPAAPALLPADFRTSPKASSRKAEAPDGALKHAPPAKGELPPDSDIRVQVATNTRTRLAKREEELAAILGRLSSALSAIGGPNNLDAHEMAMEEFLKLVTLQREMAAEVLAGYEQFKTAMATYRKDLERAPEAYRQAAGYYRERATAEENEFFQKSYTLLAENCDAYARLVLTQRKELEEFLTEVGKTVAFVEKTATFLKDFEDFVRLTPGLDTGAARREFWKQLQQYAKAFDAFHLRFLEFSRKLREQAFSDGLSTEHSKTQNLIQSSHTVIADYEREIQDSKSKWAVVKMRWTQLHAAGKGDEAVKIRDAAIYDHAARVANRYREVPLKSVRAGKAVLETPDPLEPGRVIPFMRETRTYAGAAVIRAKLGEGRYEVEPLAGTFAESDIAVIKV